MLLKMYAYNLKISRFSETNIFLKKNQTISNNKKNIGEIILKNLCGNNVKEINKKLCSKYVKAQNIIYN